MKDTHRADKSPLTDCVMIPIGIAKHLLLACTSHTAKLLKILSHPHMQVPSHCWTGLGRRPHHYWEMLPVSADQPAAASAKGLPKIPVMTLLDTFVVSYIYVVARLACRKG